MVAGVSARDWPDLSTVRTGSDRIGTLRERPGRDTVGFPAPPRVAERPVTVEASDLSLVQRVQRGDRGAFDALVLKYQHKVVKLVMRYVRNPAEAEDVAQEAFIKAYRALPKFRGDSAFYTWLYRIAINTAKNAAASRGRSPIEYELDRGDGEESHEVQARMKDTATPEALAMTEEIRSTVNAAIEALPSERVATLRDRPSRFSALFRGCLEPETGFHFRKTCHRHSSSRARSAG